ncbi:HlyD family secretion protein [Bradyrhizobium tropiciagri]|uniref:HlyD family secretion protein n=1 Tax=Bradyrhizobium tropiciagri TaxID=312253 RepID=UPI001BA4D0BE|nr:HlyD family secretion protein [Bradyrhizobium tropiciagri]MBR0870087.1 HlyD family secretion protein [Bradyrhizobium tropiciagri]
MYDDTVLERGEARRAGIDGSSSIPASYEPDFGLPETTRAPAPERPVGKEPAGPAAARPETTGKAPRSGLLRRRPVVSAIGAVLIAATIGGGYLYMDYADHFESTDDAFIAARQSALAPKVAGYIVAVPVTDNQHVNAGDVIARLDDRDYRVALAQAEAQVAAAQANIQNADAQLDVQRAQIDASQAQVDQAQAALVFAQQQATRFQHLEQTGYGTVQNSEQFTSQLHQQQAALLSAKATLNLAQRQIEALNAQRKSAVANLAQMQAQRDQAELNLSYTTVRAAQPGRVVNLTAAVGQFAQAGTNLSMFVPDQSWVTANFKEIQLDRMRPGEKVTLRIDAYPNREIHGHVESVQPGSGTAFSLLPAQNATGNYVKIVQRVPVKIVMDNPSTDVALGPGMSVVPTVRVDAAPSLIERLGKLSLGRML